MFILIGLFLGLALNSLFINKNNINSAYKIHPAKSDFKLINPLIAFEVSSDQNAFQELAPLHRRLEDFVGKEIPAGYQVSIYYRGMENSHWFGINENDEYDPASLYKVPFMIAYLKIAETDPVVLPKKITFTAEDADNDKDKLSAQAASLVEGRSYSIEELIEKMIIGSENSAKNLLLKNIDLNNVASVFEELGIPFLGEDYYKISAKKYSLFFRILYNSTFLNREMSEKALDILSRANFAYGLSGGLPKDTPMAHKFGDHAIYKDGKIIGFELHDCGIIYSDPDKPYFLCVMTRGDNLQSLSQIIQRVSRIVYEEKSSL